MTTIWKYEAPWAAEFSVEMPRGAEVLCVQEQHGTPKIWARLDPDRPEERRSFRWVGTGIEDETIIGWSYVGTIQHNAFVFHLFAAPPSGRS